MKPLAAALVLALGLVLLTACGGGGSTSPTTDEKAWAAELQAVMGEGEKTIEAAEQRIDSASTRRNLEAAYRTYADKLSTVVTKLRETDAPAACSSVKSHVVGFLHEFDSITAELGRQASTDEKHFQALVKEDTTAAQAFVTMMERIGSKGHC